MAGAIKNFNLRSSLNNIFDKKIISKRSFADKHNVSRSTLNRICKHNEDIGDHTKVVLKRIIEDFYSEYMLYNKLVVHKFNNEKQLGLSGCVKFEKRLTRTLEDVDKIIMSHLKTHNHSLVFKTRHRNLNSDHYHMKVQNQHLLLQRPLCPVSCTPMLLKEEFFEYKKLNKVEKEQYLLKLLDYDNSYQSIIKCLFGKNCENI